MKYEKNSTKICFKIIYKPKEYEGESVKILGEKFVNRNKNKCKIIYKNKEYELKGFFEEIDPNYNNKNKITLKLKIFNNIINMSHMFYECRTLLTFQNIQKSELSSDFHNEKIRPIIEYDLSHNSFEKLNSGYNDGKNDIYFGCNQKFKHQSLESKSDNSTLSFKKDLIKIKNELSIFLNSNIINLNIKSKENESTKQQLQSLSSIVEENVSNNKKNEDKIIKNKNSLLVPLNYLNIIDMSYMFYDCNSLILLPDISKWNTENVENMNSLFFNCNSLKSLPDISKWKTSKVTNMGFIFFRCGSFESLPDLSNWDTSNCHNMESFFLAVAY